MVVHQHCHKCKICGINMNLKLYYEELVCVKHINELTCRVSDMLWIVKYLHLDLW